MSATTTERDGPGGRGSARGATTASSPARGGAARPPRSRADTRAGYAFLSPWLLGFGLLTAGPMLMSLYLAFTDYNLFRAPELVGIDNFTALFADPRFLKSAQVTAVYVLVGVPV